MTGEPGPAPPRAPTRPGALERLGAALTVLTALTVAVADQTILRGEEAVLERVNDLPSWAGWPLRLVMQLGTLGVAVVVVAIVARCTWHHERVPTLATGAAVAIAFRLDNVLKDIIDRPRPAALLDDLHVRDAIDGFGYPSGHTTMAFALAASLHPVLPRAWRAVAWVLAALAGVARMHVGAHWPADVVGGAALGTAIGSATWLAASALTRGRSDRATR